jgi:hypothetical protein
MTKTNSKTSKPHLLRRVARQDRTFVALLLTLIFTCLWMVIDVFINTRASQIQTWYRFVAYGIENYSRNVWTYTYAWALLAVLITSLHIALATKLLKTNYREVASLILGLGIILIIIANVSFNLILGLPR